MSDRKDKYGWMRKRFRDMTPRERLKYAAISAVWWPVFVFVFYNYLDGLADLLLGP